MVMLIVWLFGFFASIWAMQNPPLLLPIWPGFYGLSAGMCILQFFITYFRLMRRP